MFKEIDDDLNRLLFPFQIKGKLSYQRLIKLYWLYLNYISNPYKKIPKREYNKYMDLFQMLNSMNKFRMNKDNITDFHLENLRLQLGKDVEL